MPAPCPGIRQVPLETMQPAPAEWSGTYARKYGVALCTHCRRWVVAHKDGTPTYHKTGSK